METPNPSLSRVYAAQERGDLAQFEEAVEDFVSANTQFVGPLLGVLNDNVGADEFGFAIIHAAEQEPDDRYVKAVIRSAAGLWEKSRRWAQIVHLRILNSPTACTHYEAALKQAPTAEKKAAREILAALEIWRPEFADRIQRLSKELF